MTALGLIHVAFALAALVSGLLVVLARKGTRYHRRVGWTYVATMVGVNITALMIYRLLGRFGPFHIAALLSLFTVIAGFLPARLRRPKARWKRIHAYWMSGSYVGLCAAAVAEVATRVPDTSFWWMAALSSALVAATGAAIIGARVPRALGGR